MRISPIRAPPLPLALCAVALVLLLLPRWAYREALPPALYALLLRDPTPPTYSRPSCPHRQPLTERHIFSCGPPPRCASAGPPGAPHVHMLFAVRGVAGKLAVTLPHNLRALGAVRGTTYVLTSPGEGASAVLAAAAAAAHAPGEGVEVFHSNVFSQDGAMFNKAGALRFLQETVVRACNATRGGLDNALLLVIDADILLPRGFPQLVVAGVAAARANESAGGPRFTSLLLGMSRISYASPRDAEAGVEAPCPPPHRGGCEAFLGYFQMYSAKSEVRYERWSSSAGLSDNLFSVSFKYRSMLPDNVVHLGVAGGDWTGLSVADEQWAGVRVKGYTYDD